MLARLCGPDRKIIRLRDKRGIYLFLIGAIPQAVTNALGRKQGLGVHWGAIGDGIADLMEAGMVDNRHKA